MFFSTRPILDEIVKVSKQKRHIFAAVTSDFVQELLSQVIVIYYAYLIV